MRKSNMANKIKEGLKRQRQREINELREVRSAKRKIGEAITRKDYHPSGHIRHGQ